MVMGTFILIDDFFLFLLFEYSYFETVQASSPLLLEIDYKM